MKMPRQRPGARAEFELGPWESGINEKTEPGALGSGELKSAVNILLDEVPGRAIKPYGNKEVAVLPSGNPPKYGYNFKKNDGTEYLLLSDGETLYVTTDLVTITQLITGLDDSAYLQFETAESRCWITNGVDATMWYDGTNLVVMDREYGNSATATTEAGTDQTHIVDASLTQADDYWNNRKVVITSGTYAGMEGTVTDFDAATDKLTISGFTANPGVGVTYMVGLIMPKGRIIRYNNGTLFIGGTTENRSEIRFNRSDDIDTGIRMSLDNPRAWPSTYQLSITQDDGDQVWTFSPAYRNKVLVTKGTAIYRLEPDSVFIFVPVLVSQEVGCRYPDSWAVKDELLHFMGNERSGVLDLYVTDLVSVRPKHKDGRLMPSFEEMYRSEPVYKYIARASADQFNTGEKSTLCETSNGKLECREINSQTAWGEVKGTTTDTTEKDNSVSGVNLLGVPNWNNKYIPHKLPNLSSPAWTVSSSAVTPEAHSTYFDVYTGKGPGNSVYNMQRDNVFDSSKNVLVAARFKTTKYTNVDYANIYLKIYTGKYYAELRQYEAGAGGSYQRTWYLNGVQIYSHATDIPDWLICITSSGSIKVWKDGVLLTTVSAPLSASNYISLNFSGVTPSPYVSSLPTFMLWYLFFHTDSVDAASIPNTLPSTGTYEVKVDYTRAPDAYGKYYYNMGSEFSGTTEAGTDATHIVDADISAHGSSYFIYTSRQVIITSGAKKGEIATITDYDSVNHKLTVTGLSGSPGIGATFEIPLIGTIAIKSQSSTDDVTYSALEDLTNGQEPGVDNSTPLRRYLKIHIILTRQASNPWSSKPGYAYAPEVDSIIGGFLWRMQAAQVGSNIAAWRKYLDEKTVPSGSSLVIKIRLAKTIATPSEGDWAAWQTIVNGNNIGTVLTDTPPPAAGEGRWLDIKIEGGPTAIGETPNLENYLLNWTEGASVRLALTAVTHKKRLYITGISSAATENDRLFVLDTKQAWTKIIGQNLNRIVAFKGLMYGLASDGDSIYQQEVEGLYTYNGTAIDSYIETGALDFGSQRFEVQAIKVGAASIISAVEVLLSYDATTYTSIGTLNFTTEGTQILRVPHGRAGKRHYVKLRVSGAQGMGINMLKIMGRYMPEEE